MKRKFTNVFLLVAISVAALTSFVSCKDYQDDLTIAMDIQDKALDEALQALKADLNAKIAALDAAQKACSLNCSTQQANLWANFDNYYKKSETYSQAEVDALLQELKDKMGAVADGKTLLDLIADAQAAAEKAAADAQAAADAAQADATSALGKIADLTAELAKVKATAEAALEKANQIDGLQSTVNTLQNTVNDIKNQLSNFVTKDELGNYATKEEVAVVRTTAEDALAKAKANETEITNLKEQYTTMLERIGNVEAKNQAQDEAIQKLTEDLTAAAEKITKAQETADKAVEDAAAAKAAADKVAEDLQNYITTNDARVQEVENAIETIKSDVSTLKETVDAIKEAQEAMQEEIDGMKEDIAQLKEDLAKVKEDLDALKNTVDQLTDRFNKQITGIIVQQAVNPLFGSINLPFGVNTNLLTTYYGAASYLGVEFPTADETYFYDGVSIFDDPKDLNDVFTDNKFTASANEPLFIDKEGNAGYLYMTVNPTNVDFSGTKFSLVTSKEKENFTLGNLKKTTDELKFGWTRAQVDEVSSNGLYKASVTIKDNFDAAKVRVNLNVDDVKDALKDVAASAKSKKISEIAQSLVKAGASIAPLANANFPAYAVKAAWTPENGDPTAVYSKYEVGAVAVKPLSYAFAKDVKFDKVPGISVVEDAIGRITKTVKSAVADAIPDDIFNFINPNITAESMIFDTSVLKEIDFQEARDQIQVTFKLNVDIPVDYQTSVTQNITINGTATTTDKDVQIEPAAVTIPADAINGLQMVIPAEQSWDGLDHTYTVEANSPVAGTATIPTVTIPGQTANVSGSSTVTIPIDIKTTLSIKDYDVSDQMKTQVINIYDNLTGALAPVNEMMKALKTYITNINSLVESVDALGPKVENLVNSNVDQIADKLYSLLDDVNAKVLPYLTPSDWLQPIMLGSANGFVRFTTSSPKNPVLINSTNLTLIPTTRTGELISPAVKKWIAVTDVFQSGKSAKGGNGACKAARIAANKAPINTILDGSVRKVNVTLQKGFTYELTYEALDYTGLVSAKKYYVRVK